MILTCNNESEERTRRLQASCNKYGYKLVTFGQGLKYRSWRQAKVDQLILELDSIDSEIVCYTDGWDSWMLRPGLIRVFKGLKTPLLVSANRDLYPSSDKYGTFPDSPTSFKYICAGGFIGYRKSLINALQRLTDLSDSENDQELWNIAWSKGILDMKVDHECKIFLNMTNVDKDELYFDNKRLTLKETRTRPFIIHFSGPKGNSPNAENMSYFWGLTNG